MSSYDPSKDEAEIRALIESWTKAVREENYDGILARHTSDFLMYDVPPPFQSRGLDAYRKTWDIFFGWSKKEKIFNVTELEITASDTVAFAHGTGHCTGLSPAGVEEKLEFRLTMGFKKIDGQWKFSPPVSSRPTKP